MRLSKLQKDIKNHLGQYLAEGNVAKVTFLIVVYIFMRDVTTQIPFINLISGLDGRSIIIGLISIFIFNFNLRMLASGVILMLFLFIAGDVPGLVAMGFIFMILIKIFKLLKKNNIKLSQ